MAKPQNANQLDLAIARAGLKVKRELDATVSPDINERLDLRVGEHVIAKLVHIQTKPSAEDSRKSTFKIYTLEDGEGQLWDMLGSADLDGRRELPQLVGHMLGIERLPDEAMGNNLSGKKKFRIVDLGVKTEAAAS